MNIPEELLISSLIDTNHFPVRIYKSDILENDEFSYRIYIIDLPPIKKLYEVTTIDNFDMIIGKQIADILCADVGKAKIGTSKVNNMKEEEDLDYLMLLYVQEYSHSYKYIIIPYERWSLDYLNSLKNNECKKNNIFIDNIDNFNVLLDMSGHIENDMFSFVMAYNENNIVNKKYLRDFIRDILDRN